MPMKRTIIFDQIFEYQIIDFKEGGMGKVLILDRISNRMSLDFIHQKKIAAKTFKGQTADNRQKFEREIGIWLNFHDYIFQQSKVVKLLKTTYVHNKLYALMPYYEKSLSDLLKNKKEFHFEEAFFVISDIVQGLKRIFENYGIVHQDLKPENIMCKKGINCRDEFHVSDWGISNIQRNMCSEIPTKEWLPSSFIEIMSHNGTLPYMSPERFRGNFSNVSSDIYAVGLIYFELIVGCLPFVNLENKPLELQIIDGDYFDNACWLMDKKFNYPKLRDFISTCIVDLSFILT
jgi:serine/threonine protein kinase